MTDVQFERLFSTQRDATIGVRAGVVTFVNPAAARQFPKLQPGEAASAILPLAVLEAAEEEFSAGITVDDTPYTVLGVRLADMFIYTLIPQAGTEPPNEQLLDRIFGTIRRTLTVLNMATELFVSGDGQEEAQKQKRHLALINKTNYQLQRLCDNLELFFRFSERQVRLYLEQFDLVDFCRDLVQSTDHLARRLSLRIHFQTDCDNLMASLDRQKVTRLLLNLISNSLKNMDEGGHLSIELTSQGEDAVILLRDTGSGMQVAHLAQAFTQYQGPLADMDTQTGIGLGLNLAQEIARLHGGTLFLTSRAGRGTAVCLRLPVSRGADSGHLQEAALPYGEGDGGMHLILTELSDVLDDEVFLGRYY